METHSGSFRRDGKFGGCLWCFQPTVLQNGSLAAPCCTLRPCPQQLLGFPVSNAVFTLMRFKAKRLGYQPPDVPSCTITHRLTSEPCSRVPLASGGREAVHMPGAHLPAADTAWGDDAPAVPTSPLLFLPFPPRLPLRTAAVSSSAPQG